MSSTAALARHLVAVLLVSLVAVFALVAGSATAGATPGWVSVGDDVAPVAAGPQSALPGRLVPSGPLSGDGVTPAGHPGPVLEVLLLAPPAVAVAGPAGTVGDHSATTGLDPGHGSRTDPRGPPAV